MDPQLNTKLANDKNLSKKHLEITVSEKICLRTLNASDVSKKYVAWLNDYEITKFTEQKYHHHTFDSTVLFVNEKFKSKKDLLFGIFFDQEHVGNIKLGPVKWEHNTTEVSYFIGEKIYWGNGIASKSLQTVVSFAVTNLGLKKINAGYYSFNIGSAKVLEKSGFVVEGERRSDVIFEGERISSILVGYVPSSK